jgi:hypothetical protein
MSLSSVLRLNEFKSSDADGLNYLLLYLQNIFIFCIIIKIILNEVK